MIYAKPKMRPVLETLQQTRLQRRPCCNIYSNIQAFRSDLSCSCEQGAAPVPVSPRLCRHIIRREALTLNAPSP